LHSILFLRTALAALVISLPKQDISRGFTINNLLKKVDLKFTAIIKVEGNVLSKPGREE
jgi:hypothetical protein